MKLLFVMYLIMREKNVKILKYTKLIIMIVKYTEEFN